MCTRGYVFIFSNEYVLSLWSVCLTGNHCSLKNIKASIMKPGKCAVLSKMFNIKSRHLIGEIRFIGSLQPVISELGYEVTAQKRIQKTSGRVVNN